MLEWLFSDVTVILKGHEVIAILIGLIYIVIRIFKLFFWYTSGE